MTVDATEDIELREKLLSAWSIETGGKWRSDTPACGQCSVTALVAQDLLGGEILKTQVEGHWHFYNCIGGRRLDLTESQFGQPLDYQDVPSNRSEALEDTSVAQYELLKGRVTS